MTPTEALTEIESLERLSRYMTDEQAGQVRNSIINSLLSTLGLVTPEPK
jgi:hypothetical protein